MKHDPIINCDNFIRPPKLVLIIFVAALSAEKVHALNHAFAVALGLPSGFFS